MNYIAVIYLGLNDRDQALKWLNQGYEQQKLWYFDLHPYLSALRADGKFHDVIWNS